MYEPMVLCEHVRTTVIIGENGKNILWCHYCGALRTRKDRWEHPEIHISAERGKQ